MNLGILGVLLFITVCQVTPHYINYPVNCYNSAWTPWSYCSVTCGNSGFRKRTRYHCHKGYEYQHKSCEPVSCPIYSTWGSWTQQAQCTNSNEQSTRLRERKCIIADNSKCDDPLTETQPCNCFAADESCTVYRFPFQDFVDVTVAGDVIEFNPTGGVRTRDNRWNLDIVLDGLGVFTGESCFSFKFNSGMKPFEMYITALAREDDAPLYGKVPSTRKTVDAADNQNEFTFDLTGKNLIYIEIYGTEDDQTPYTVSEMRVGSGGCQ